MCRAVTRKTTSLFRLRLIRARRATRERLKLAGGIIVTKSYARWSGSFLAMTASTMIGVSSLALSSAQTLVQQVPGSATSSSANLVDKSRKPEESDQLQEITVTAQRRTENLQAVPIAITVVTNEQLLQSGIQSSSDLAAVVPGLVLQSSENGLRIWRGWTAAHVWSVGQLPLLAGAHIG